MKKNIVLVGGGGHCISVIDVIESTNKFNIVGILDMPNKVGQVLLNYKYLGTDEDYRTYINKGYSFVITVGQIKTSDLRIRIFQKLKNLGAILETIISPFAQVSKHAKIGEGTVILHHAVINAVATINPNCIINTGALIEHETIIGAHTHVSTNSTINGNVTVGERCFIGSNSVISNNLEIADQVLIGAGSTVIKSIYNSGTFVGSPSKKIN